MTLQHDRYLNALLRNWWVILLAIVSALGLALGRATLATPIYSTSATFIISPIATMEDNDDILRSLNTLNQETVAITYVEIMVSSRIIFEAADSAGIDRTDLSDYQFNAIQLPDSNVLRLTVSGPRAEKITELADKVGEQAIEFGETLYPIYQIQFLDSAPLSTQAISPTPSRDAVIAIGIGAGLGLILALFTDDLRSLLYSGVAERPIRNESVEVS